MTPPLVSVIVPAFNAERWIGETLDSILAQTYRRLEIIVVDDGSTDRTANVVRAFGSRVLYKYQANSGGCAVPRNHGISLSSGELLCFLDADDLFVPDRVATQVAFMERNPQVGLVFSNYRNFDSVGSSPTTHFETCPCLWQELGEREELILENPCQILAQENFGISGSMMFRRALLELEPGFEPTLRACEDFHLFYRLSRHTPAGVVNAVGMLRRMHGHNMTTDATRMLLEGVRSRTLLLGAEKDARTRRYLNRYIATCHQEYARHRANHGQYLQAVQHDWFALANDARPRQLLAFMGGITRTFAIAARAHHPKS